MLARFRQQLSSLKHKWLRAFTEVETGYGLLVNDLQLLQHSVKDAMGTPIPLGGMLHPLVWTGMASLKMSVGLVSQAMTEQSSHLANITDQQNCILTLVTHLELLQDEATTSLTSKISAHDVDLCSLERRLLTLVPVLQQFRWGS